MDEMDSFDVRQDNWQTSNGRDGKLFCADDDISMKPTVLTGMKLDFLNDDDDKVATSLKEFGKDFSNSTWRESAERAMRANVDSERSPTAANDCIISTLLGFLPRGAIVPPSLQGPLATDLALSNFGLKEGSYHASLEKHQLWAARLSTSGRRQVCVVDLDDCKKHMREKAVMGKKVQDFMKEMSSQGISEFTAKFPTHTATIDRADMVLIPANSIVLDQVAGNNQHTQ